MSMSKNLSRTLFYEFCKSDPNFIYESVEEYRSFKSDPDFADKTIEEYRRAKALEKKEMTSNKELTANEEETSFDESQSEYVTNDTTLTTTENEVEAVNDSETEHEQDSKIQDEENIVDEIQVAITELKVESSAQQAFNRSLEQFWTRDNTETSIFASKSPSICSSETLSILASETELNTNRSKKRTKSRFKIPKSQSTINLRKVKSRYMDVFKKNE